MVVKGIAVAAALVVAAASPLGMGTAQAQDDGDAPKWLVNCANTGEGGALLCRMSQILVHKESRRRIMSIVVQHPPADDDPTMLLSLPHGLFLPAGVVMTVDGGEKKGIPIQTCDPRGCYAGMRLDTDMLGELFGGDTLEFTVQDMQRQPVELESTLIGFSDAFGQLNK